VVVVEDFVHLAPHKYRCVPDQRSRTR